MDDGGRHLDIKGAGWICAFPAPNVTVPLDGDVDSDQYDEKFEADADSDPRGDIDFLGNGVDCGFRVSGQAAPDRFAISVELAWLLAEANHREVYTGTMLYHQRQPLKGVLRERPYPLVSINTERSDTRREVGSLERSLWGGGETNAVALRNFLEAFMRDERIELPYLPDDNLGIMPDSYQKYEQAWKAEWDAMAKVRQTEAASASADENDGGAVPEDIERGIDDAIAQAPQQDRS